MKPLIELKDVTKEFNGQVVLRGVDLEIYQNEFVTLLGPSGCGKTTTLRIIGGFVEPSSGEVLFNDRSILDIPAHKRPTNTVFQRYALFPHLDVFENVAFGLRVKPNSVEIQNNIKMLKDELTEKLDADLSKHEIKQLKNEYKTKIKELKNSNILIDHQIRALKTSYASLIKEDPSKRLELNEKIKALKDTKQTKKSMEKQLETEVLKYLKLVGLEGYENRSVNRLSGGQQQRVAIARALINKPQVLLLDEPLAALDLKLRQEMQYELKELQRSAGITFIFVTHDQEEALTMSDKIVVMNQGEIQQIGTPEDIYNEPINRFVAEFIGESNIISGIMKDDLLVHFDGKDYVCVDKGFARNQAVDIVIRPEDIDIVPKGTGYITGVVDSVAFKGVHYEIDVKTSNRIFTIHTTDISHVNDEVDLTFNPEDLHIMEEW